MIMALVVILKDVVLGRQLFPLLFFHAPLGFRRMKCSIKNHTSLTCCIKILGSRAIRSYHSSFEDHLKISNIFVAKASSSCLSTGFLQQFGAVLNPDDDTMNIGKVLNELSGGRPINRVLCTGHSLGGALATLGKTKSYSQCSSLLFISIWSG